MRQIIPFFLFGFYGLILLCFSPEKATAQPVRGQLIQADLPPELTEYFSTNGLNLENLRKLTNILTDQDWGTQNGIILPNRKKAFVRHVKQLSEKLEEVYFRNWPIRPEDYELIYELVLLQKAFIAQGKMDEKGALGVFEKVKMIMVSYQSQHQFKYKIPKIIPQNTLDEPTNSPYWQQNNSQIPLEKRFAELAKSKKIKDRDTLVILFKEFSYTGSAPKIKTYDLDLDNEWMLKWGDEVHTDIAGSRLFACLGYDVDHPYFYSKEKLTLIFDPEISSITSAQLKDSLTKIYRFDLAPFIYSEGIVSDKMVNSQPNLAPFLGREFLQFKKCAVEARPDRVKRIGPLDLEDVYQANRKELRGALLAHAWIDNWDTRAANTVLTTVHQGNYKYRLSSTFSDLGTSFGVELSPVNRDFKVGLVNEFSWELAHKKGNKVSLAYRLNSLPYLYKTATYSDLYWMATKIAAIDGKMLEKIMNKTGWPTPIAHLYYYKLASRRASILSAFDIVDPHPIFFDENYSYSENGVEIINNGELIVDYGMNENPESFLNTKGRFRNYGH